LKSGAVSAWLESDNLTVDIQLMGLQHGVSEPYEHSY
jgi:hypothetical protein